MQSFNRENEEGLDQIEGAVGLGEIELAEEHEVDRSFDLGDERIKQVEIFTFKAGLEDAVKHQDNNHLDNDVDSFPYYGAGVTAHDSFTFRTQFDRVVLIFLFNFFDPCGNGGFLLLRAISRKVQGEKDDLDHDREDDHGNTHVRNAGLTEGPVDENQNIKERLIDIGDKKTAHRVSITHSPTISGWVNLSCKSVKGWIDKYIQFMYNTCICGHKHLILRYLAIWWLEWIWWLRMNIETGAS